MSEATKRYRIGLDLGTNSIGWAVLEEDDAGTPVGLLDCGVRIFQEATDADGVPKNQARRQARSARRTLARYRMRRDRLVSLLTTYNLLPANESERRAILTDLKSYDPYRIRAEGLSRPLTRFEFGRAIYHLNQRRGFQSNRRQGGSAEDGPVKESISALHAAMEASQTKTLGEYLFTQQRRRNRPPLHDRYTERSMYKHEFNALCDAQATYQPELLSDGARAELYRALFFQRPLKSQKFLVGRCTFEPSRKRAAKAWPEAQRCRYLQDINALGIKNPITRELRTLTNEERSKLRAALEVKDLSWSAVRRLLGLHRNEQFNLEDSKLDKLKGNRSNGKLTEVLGAKWTNLSQQKQHELITDLLTIEDAEPLLRRLEMHWGFSKEEALRVSEIDFEKGYFKLSLKATRAILPHLERGLMYHEACKEAGYNHSKPKTSKVVEHLPPPPSLRNPVVQKALFEVRKVMKALLQKHRVNGKPSSIIVEMAKDMKMGRGELAEYEKERKRRERENKAIALRLETEWQIASPSRDDIEKVKLWEEAAHLCPYTGTVISQEMLFSPEVEVEHIVPFSRSLDDSYMNKTIAMASVNRRKKDNTPYEMYAGAPEDYAEVLRRVAAYPPSKRKRFELREVVTDDFISRQLNDTRYICVEVQRYLEQLGVEINITKGPLTAMIRRALSTGRLLSGGSGGAKSRDDHRHHAVDALVIALTSKRLYHQLSQVASRRPHGGLRIELPLPWENFHSSVSGLLESLNISFAARRKLAGALHDQNPLGYNEREGVFVKRYALAALTKSQLDSVRDPVIKGLIEERLQSGNGDIKKTFTKDPPLVHKDGKTPIRRVRVSLSRGSGGLFPRKDSAGRAYQYFPFSNNHHVEVLENTTDTTRELKFVTTFEATRRARISKSSIVNREHGEGKRFLFSLCLNDVVEYTDNRIGRNLFRVQALSQGRDGFEITLRLQRAALSERGVSSGEVRIRGRKELMKLEKVSVSVLGEVLACND